LSRGTRLNSRERQAIGGRIGLIFFVSRFADHGKVTATEFRQFREQMGPGGRKSKRGSPAVLRFTRLDSGEVRWFEVERVQKWD